MTPRKRTSFFVDVELASGLKALKARDGVPEAEAIRRAIADYLERRGIAVTGKSGRRPVSGRRGAPKSRQQG